MRISNKQKFLVILIIIPVIAVLLIVNSFITGSSEEQIQNQEVALTSEALKQVIPAHIDSILFSFGIKKDWIKNLNPSVDTIKTKKVDKLPTRYKSSWLLKQVSVPKDLPLSTINYELTNYLHSLKLNTIAYEDPKNSAVSLEVLNNEADTGNVEAVIQLVYNDSLVREASEIALILTNTEQYALNDLKGMLDMPEEFAMVLPIDYKYSDLQSAILESGKDYVLVYSVGVEDDFSADFRDKMPEKEWKSKIKSISAAFPKSSAIILNNPEELYKYEKAVREQFLEYRPNVFRDTLYTDLSKLDGGHPVEVMYNDIIEKSKAGKKYLIYMAEFSPGDFKYYIDKMYELRKKGYKFVSLSRILKKITVKRENVKEITDSTNVSIKDGK